MTKKKKLNTLKDFQKKNQKKEKKYIQGLPLIPKFNPKNIKKTMKSNSRK